MEKVRKWNRKNIKNYIEIYIKSSLFTVQKFSNKKIYKKKYIQDVVGLDIKPEYPKNPDIIIKNDFKSSLKKKSRELVSKINILI